MLRIYLKYVQIKLVTLEQFITFN